MKTGDALVWKDSEVLHGRNGFIAKSFRSIYLEVCCKFQ